MARILARAHFYKGKQSVDGGGGICKVLRAPRGRSTELRCAADVMVSPPDVAQALLLLSTAASEPMGSYAQMVWYGVESPYKP